MEAALAAEQNGIDFNNRVVQPLNHRVVSYRHCPATTMESTAAKWVYANKGETEANAEAQKHTWGGLCVTGREQSPIDVVTSAVVTGDAPPTIETRISAVLKYVKNTGYALQLFETSPSTHELHQHGGGAAQGLLLDQRRQVQLLPGPLAHAFGEHRGRRELSSGGALRPSARRLDERGVAPPRGDRLALRARRVQHVL